MSGIATPPESDAGSDLTEHHQDVDASVPVPPDDFSTRLLNYPHGRAGLEAHSVGQARDGGANKMEDKTSEPDTAANPLRSVGYPSTSESSRDGIKGESRWQSREETTRHQLDDPLLEASDTEDTTPPPADPDTMKLHFHVIIESEFKYDRKEAQVYVRFKDPSRGIYVGSIEPQQELQKVRNFDDGSCLMTTSIDTPVRYLRGLQGKLVYKYCLIRREDWHTMWEAVKDDGDRERMIPASKITPSSCLHFHDGIMMRKLSKWKLPTTAQYKAEILMALREMMPSWEGLCPIQKNDRCVTAEDVIKHIRNLEREMMTWPIWAFTNLYQKDCFKKALEEYFGFWLNNLNQPYWKVSEELISLRVASVMCLFALMDTYEIIMSLKDNRKMMNALQIQLEEKQNVYDEYFGSLKAQFSEDTKRKLPEHIKNVINRGLSANKCDFAWLKCVPLLHFLEGTNKPYEIPVGIYDENHRTLRWWGLQRKGMKDIVELSKINFKTPEPQQVILDGLESLFEVDRLLPRTILASLSHEHIPYVLRWDKMPPEAVLAMVFYHLDQGIDKPQHILKDLPLFIKKSCRLYQTKCSKHQTQMVTLMRKICMDILRTTTTKYPDDNSVIPVMEAVLEVVQTEKSCNENLRRIGLDLQTIAIDWFNKGTRQGGLIVKFKALGGLYQLDFPYGQKAWKDKVLGCLRGIIAKMEETDTFNVYRDGASRALKHQELIDVLNRHTFMAAKGVMKSANSGAYLSNPPEEVMQMFSNIFMERWPKEIGHPTSDPLVMLHHILTDENIKSFLEFFTKEDENTMTGLTKDCRDRLHKSAMLLDSIRDSLVSGDISLSQLEVILKHQEKFAAIASIDPKCCMSKDVMFEILQRRREQLDSVKVNKQHTKDLQVMCSHLSLVDISDLKHQLAEFEKDPRINDCGDPVRFDPNQDTFVADTSSKVIFQITSDDTEILQSLLKWKECKIFQKILQKACENHIKSEPGPMAGQGQMVTVDDFLHQVVPASEKTWLDLCGEVKDGSVTLENVLTYFGEMHMREAERELGFIFNREDDSHCQFCLTQIDGYWTLLKCKDSMDIVNEARKTMQLDGDFRLLDELYHLETQKTNTLSCFTEGTIQVIKRLACLSRDDIDCIKTFLECKTLVDWLKENVKELKELKTLVDLALISAEGQGDLEVTKVSCLHAAVSGFAPLIYDLGPTAGFERFLGKYQDVWEALNADGDLPMKLRDLNDQIQWLKDVKDAQGDVRLNALKQVSAINSRGIYVVGCQREQSFQTYEDVISVKVEPDDNQDEGRHKKPLVFSGQDLKDLQSRLMLVAGKGNEEVDTFVERFDGVTTLGRTFIELHAAGNILFKTWTASFHCDPNRRVNTVINFLLSDCMLQGLSDSDVTKQIYKIGQFLEGCLKDWKQYIEDKRTEFPELSLYTTEQLVMLCKGLAAKPEDLKDSVFVLLHDVHPACSQETLQEALRKAATEIKRFDAHDWVAYLYDKFTPSIVRRALEICPDHSDRIQVEFTCIDLENITEDEDDNIPTAHVQSEETLSSFMKKFDSDGSTTRPSTLQQKLEMLWQKFSSSTSMSMKDCLSIDHVGRILKHLARLEVINRPLPTFLEKGRPNLLVLPEMDTFLMVLSVYMENEKLPLPSRNEVLLCNEDTTAEDVELLLRRVVSDKTGQIFMLVNVHMLAYEVECHAETVIEKYTKDEHEYNLVLMCSSDHQNRSQLVTSFDNYRVNTPARPALNDVQKYLKTHLQGGEGASEVDPEGCCVRLVCSERPGTGKTLWVKRAGEKLRKKYPGSRKGAEKCRIISLPLYGTAVTNATLLNALIPHTSAYKSSIRSLYHIDIPHEMQKGVDHLLFNLIVLGSLVDQSGRVWRRDPKDLYVIESLPLLCWELSTTEGQMGVQESFHHIFKVLPTVTCHSPKQSYRINSARANNLPSLPNVGPHDRLIDKAVFSSEAFQRVYRYLVRLDTTVNSDVRQSKYQERLKVLLRHCGIEDPTWGEVNHFVKFLNVQLKACEESTFCNLLPGFLDFVVKFMIHMSRDFSTRSLDITEDMGGMRAGSVVQEASGKGDSELSQFQLKRRWESSPHPYIFFNSDQATMTFLGFIVDQKCNIVDPQTEKTFFSMQPALYTGLDTNNVNLREIFDSLDRQKQIAKLRLVMGSQPPDPVKPARKRTSAIFYRILPEDVHMPPGYDPDDKYVLTEDNAKKILAIQMRFRCNIPVVIMGETGCGKTYLIKFMCSLQCPPGEQVKNMMLMKVHGGTTGNDITRKVLEAKQLAKTNRKKYPSMFTVLFLDEVNTTEALGLVKEVLCDNSLNGRPLGEDCGLRLIAACNPYRKHSQEMIQKLEKAGLGYNVNADETSDKLGRIPMRQLVYRVQPLPQSLLPLVWDFGQLQPLAEESFINQIVKNKMADPTFPTIDSCAVENITIIILSAQMFMKQQKDECSFVSLRDVERTMDVMTWFYEQRHNLFPLMDEWMRPGQGLGNDEEKKNEFKASPKIPKVFSDLRRSLILALGVCYHAGLHEKRSKFRDHISNYFEGAFKLEHGSDTIRKEISACQDVFLKEIQLPPTIARNQALKENVFMMVVCIELRLPLFLVGKPGSSKSLAKTIVADAMQGPNSRSEFFKKLKQVHMLSYQCSPLSTPDGIVSTFKQCGQLQKSKGDLNRFVSVVVLDEIGLAEDSPKMPLKALHPLLEDGCEGDGEAEDYMQVGFIGISNWALDPAKMNRGILVQRAPFDVDELEATARDICSYDTAISEHIEPLMRPLAEAYLELYNKAITDKQEFFGLRDFYSLVKMVYGFAQEINGLPSRRQLEHAILRNFGGLQVTKPLEVFQEHLQGITHLPMSSASDPDNSPQGLMGKSISGHSAEGGNRYLLVMTENQAALRLLRSMNLLKDANIIYGSSFPGDQDYVVVCRNINQIKVCMETGQTVVLLNLESLYESLYDVLNQYYTYFGGQRHVDLGLGSHRVKARVHENFRLIVVAEKDVVYERFRIPLINRLEKHFIAMSTTMSPQQQDIAEKLSEWAQHLVQSPQGMNLRRNAVKPVPGDVFIGYHSDACATIALHVSGQVTESEDTDTWANEVLQRSKRVLLYCVTPEAILRVSQIPFQADNQDLFNIYFKDQKHSHLLEYMSDQAKNSTETTFTQVTTHSRLLSKMHMEELKAAMRDLGVDICFQSLQAFRRKQQFSDSLRDYFSSPSDTHQVLIIQCDSGDKKGDLIDCARFCIMEEYQRARQMVDKTKNCQKKRDVLILMQLPRVAGGCFVGFQGDDWQSVHLDELRTDPYQLPPVEVLMNESISSLVGASLHNDETSHHEGQTLSFALDQLLISCVHGATAMLKDKSPEVKGTARIKKLLDLLKKQQLSVSECTFVRILNNKIHHLLVERAKQTALGPFAKAWLCKQVASVEAVNKAGTFRNSLWQYFEKKITPILAGIIAFIDTNSNLSLFGESDTEHWKEKMWLESFKNPSLTPISYEDLVSAKDGTELKEMVVQTTGAHGSPMTAKLPFSWLLKTLIDDVMEQRKKVEGDGKLLSFEGAFLKQSPWWPVLEAAFTEAGPDVVRDCYLEDYVRMVYKPRTNDPSKEYILVKRAIHSVVVKLKKQKSETLLGLETILPMVHVAEACIHSRLQLFSEVTTHQPEVVDNLSAFVENNPENPLASPEEMGLDVLAMKVLVEKVQTSYEQLRDLQSSRDWQQKVEMTSPLVNTILTRASLSTQHTSGVGGYSHSCQQLLREIKADWNRVTTVKLFANIVFPEGSEDEKDITKFGPPFLRVLMGIETDLKTKYTLEVVEKYLRSVILNISRTKACPSCHDVVTTVIVMPCQHELCEECIECLRSAGNFACFSCKTGYPRTQKLIKKIVKWTPQEKDKVHKFKQRCNAFLLEIVSRMCFVGTTPPDKEVVDALMGYVTKQPIGGVSSRKMTKTKRMSIFNDDLDPSPVVRSVLLQLLLKSSVEEVHDHLVTYFEDSCKVATSDRDLQELAVIYIQCLEDHYFQTLSVAPQCSGRVQQATILLRESHEVLFGDKDIVDQLDGIAKAHLGLRVAADWMVKVYIENQTGSVHLDELFSTAKNICSNEKASRSRLYLQRQIARRYSFNYLQKVGKVQTWLTDVSESTSTPDRFVIWKCEYIRVRDILTRCLEDGTRETIPCSGQGVDANDQCRLLMLALFHLAYTKCTKGKKHSAEVIERIQFSCEGVVSTRAHEDLVQRLLTNTLAQSCPQLTLTPDLDHDHLSLLEIIMHFMICMETTNNDNLIEPIKKLITDPTAMKEVFLPTMPEDNRQEIYDAVVQREGVWHRIYECANGHVYIIGECGKPWVSAECPTCKLPIGGMDHKLSKGNQEATLADQTKPGHCLGPAGNRSLVPAPERTMSPACVALIRLLVHLALYVGANTKINDIYQLITPEISKKKIPKFLWQHILCDLEVLCRAVGKGKDDTLLLVHLLIRDIAVNKNVCHGTLDGSKETRKDWETKFSVQLVMPLLENLENRLDQANQEITSDLRNDMLRQRVYESHEEQPAMTESENQAFRNIPAMWRFRTRISIEHLTQELNARMAIPDQHRVLQLFLKQESLLRMVQLIPDILEFLEILRNHYHRKVNREEADKLKLKDFKAALKKANLKKRFKGLLLSFVSAWNSVHISLQTHVVSGLGKMLPQEHCLQEITDESPLSTFLPNHRGPGLCGVALLDYLTTVHNNFMAEYSTISGKGLRTEVSFLNLTPAHLITYDPDRDLLPLVMANCTYSLEVGQGTKIEYNFNQLEQQLEERFIKGKGTLQFELETVSFREDLNNTSLFKSLNRKIPQKPFSSAVQNEITADARIMVEVSNCLANLDIAIGFLVSVGGDPKSSLHSFMTDTLQMRADTLTPRARERSKLCHTKALWLLFSHEREKMVFRNNQEPFTSFDCTNYAEELSDRQIRNLEAALRLIKVNQFLGELHECILLHITVKADQYDEDHVDNRKQRLDHVLAAYIEGKEGPEIPALTNDTFPDNIRVEQCVDTWRVACQYMQATSK